MGGPVDLLTDEPRIKCILSGLSEAFTELAGTCHRVDEC